MLQCKTFEVRDAMTFIPCVGILCEAQAPGEIADAYLLRRAGYNETRCVIFTRLDGHGSNVAPYDPVDWGHNRTMRLAHEYVLDFWDELENGAVVDVEFIMGARDKPKESERTTPSGDGPASETREGE